MNGKELTDLIDQRHQMLAELLDISRRQMEAIQAGRMSQLMRLLSDKQAPLGRLGTMAERIRAAADDDPASRQWENEQARSACRQRQDECEQMHLELLAIEAECETALQQNRHKIGEKLERVDACKRAAEGYASAPAGGASGGQLDLSSD